MRKLVLLALLVVGATTYAQDKTRMFISGNTNTSQAIYESLFEADLGEKVTFTNKVTYATDGAFISHFKRLDLINSMDIKLSRTVVLSMGHIRHRNLQVNRTFNSVFYKLEVKLF